MNQIRIPCVKVIRRRLRRVGRPIMKNKERTVKRTVTIERSLDKWFKALSKDKSLVSAMRKVKVYFSTKPTFEKELKSKPDITKRSL